MAIRPAVHHAAHPAHVARLAVMTLMLALAAAGCDAAESPDGQPAADTLAADPGAAPAPPPPGQDPPAGQDRRAVTLEGEVTAEGVECLAMRGQDSALYTLIGHSMLEQLEPGAWIYVEGVEVDYSICQQGTTLEVTHVERR
jgi:hypothetical protein